MNLFEFGLVVKEEMLFKDTSILAQWSGTIYASLIRAIMGNIHVKYFKGVLSSVPTHGFSSNFAC